MQQHSFSHPGIAPEDLVIKDIADAETIPAHWYTDERLYQIERDGILKTKWLYAGHESQLPSPGSYRVDDILGMPVLLVRNQRGDIHAFHNVCRHRGGPIATQDGQGRMLRCAYHGWTYNLDGELAGTPRFEGVNNFHKEDCRLPRIPLAKYEGFLFINFADNPEPIDTYVGGIRERIRPIDLKTMQFYRRVTYPLQANWKVYVDNYLEGYHILPVHPELAKILDVSGYTTEIHSHRVLQYGPFSGDDNPYHATSGGVATYYFVYPNIMFNITPGRVQMNSILPLSHDRTLVVFDFFYTEKDPARLAQLAQDDHQISDVIQKQDVSICEQVQKGLASGSYDKGRFSVQEEKGVHAFQAMLKRDLAHLLARS